MRGASLMAIGLTLPLAGCSGSIEFGPRPAPAPVVIPAAGAATVIEPNGAVIEERTPIETVITGLSQAQQVRTLTRQLSR